MKSQFHRTAILILANTVSLIFSLNIKVRNIYEAPIVVFVESSLTFASISIFLNARFNVRFNVEVLGSLLDFWTCGTCWPMRIQIR